MLKRAALSAAFEQANMYYHIESFIIESFIFQNATMSPLAPFMCTQADMRSHTDTSKRPHRNDKHSLRQGQ
jgi:hypothetical protein